MNRLRFVAKSLAHGAIEWSGRPRRQRRRLRGKLIILTYHSFCTEWPRGLFSSLPVARFERQVRFLQASFKLVSLEQGLHYLQQGYVDDKPWVAITIDDGFLDNYTHAWPVLQRYDVPATIFLATDFIDTGRPPWSTQLVEILERTEVGTTEAPFRADLNSFSERSAVARQLKKAWSPLPPMERFAKLAELRSRLRVDEKTHYPGLTWDQVRAIRAGGISFGSHTSFHSILPDMDPEIVKHELRNSRLRIESEMQEPCVMFAYPDGKHNRESKGAVESCGYEIAVTQDLDCNHDFKDRLELKRIEIPFNDSMPSFRGRVCLSLPSRSQLRLREWARPN